MGQAGCLVAWNNIRRCNSKAVFRSGETPRLLPAPHGCVGHPVAKKSPHSANYATHPKLARSRVRQGSTVNPYSAAICRGADGGLARSAASWA